MFINFNNWFKSCHCSKKSCNTTTSSAFVKKFKLVKNKACVNSGNKIVVKVMGDFSRVLTLCRHFGCGITVCDVGVNADIREPKVLNRKIAYGTQNIAQGPAMTREQAMKVAVAALAE